MLVSQRGPTHAIGLLALFMDDHLPVRPLRTFQRKTLIHVQFPGLYLLFLVLLSCFHFHDLVGSVLLTASRYVMHEDLGNEGVGWSGDKAVAIELTDDFEDPALAIVSYGTPGQRMASRTVLDLRQPESGSLSERHLDRFNPLTVSFKYRFIHPLSGRMKITIELGFLDQDDTLLEGPTIETIAFGSETLLADGLQQEAFIDMAMLPAEERIMLDNGQNDNPHSLVFLILSVSPQPFEWIIDDIRMRERPEITSINVTHDLFHEASEGFRATLSSHALGGIANDSIRLILNGQDLSQDLTIEGGPGLKTCQYDGLEPGKSYTGEFQVTDSAGETRRVSLGFDTFMEGSTTLIEAEDFNFDGGQFIDDPQLNNTPGGSELSYFDKVGLQGIDRFEINFGGIGPVPQAEVYRFGPGFTRQEWVGTRVTDDYQRPHFTEAPPNPDTIYDYHVDEMVPGEWLEYTRNLEPGRYAVFARVSRDGPEPFTLLMEQRVADPDGFNPILYRLGEFKGDTLSWHWASLTDAGGMETGIHLEETLNTFRITLVEGHARINSIALIRQDTITTAPQVHLDFQGADVISSDNQPLLIDIMSSDADGAVDRIELEYVREGGGAVENVFSKQSNILPLERLEWVPSDEGIFHFTAHAEDDHGHRNTARYRIEIDNSPPRLMFAGKYASESVVGLYFNEPIANMEQVTVQIGDESSRDFQIDPEYSQHLLLPGTENIEEGTTLIVEGIEDQQGNRSEPMSTHVDLMTLDGLEVGSHVFPAKVLYQGATMSIESFGQVDFPFYLFAQTEGDFMVQAHWIELSPVNERSIAGLGVSQGVSKIPSEFQQGLQGTWFMTPFGKTIDGERTGRGLNSLFDHTGYEIGLGIPEENNYHSLWMRIVKEGDSLTSYTSRNGLHWDIWGEYSLTGQGESTLQTGLITTSNQNLPGYPGLARIGAFQVRNLTPPDEPIKLNIIRISEDLLRLEWDGGGILQSSESVTGPWLNMEGVQSPFQILPMENRFYRVCIE